MAEKKKLAAALLEASFRGVPFQVENTDLDGGRRTQQHDYPQRDKPYVEDLGRAARVLSFAGFVVGDDYVAQAGSLLSALEAAGPGTLIHPWFGTMTVSVTGQQRVSFDSGLGVARFSLSFVESGELEFPTAESSTQTATRTAASALEASAVSAFIDRYSVKGFQDFVSAAATGNLGDMLGIISSSEVGKILGWANSLASTTLAAIALVSNPATLGYKLLGAFGLSGLATSVAAWTSVVRSISRVVMSGSMDAPTKSASSGTASRAQATLNADAIYALGRQALLAQAIGASSLVGTQIDVPASGLTQGVADAGETKRPLISYADMIAARDELVSAIDRESLSATDGVYDALQSARLAVWKDLTERSRESARLTTLKLPGVTPALVVAYDYYEDADRAADIVARNGLRNPGFVPATALKVLTR